MISVAKLTGTIGAEISGVDLAEPLDGDTVEAIRQALFDNIVIFFRDQRILTDDEHMRLGRYFGTLDISEIQPGKSKPSEVLVLDTAAPKGAGADTWHRDRTYLEAPPLGSILQCVEPPSLGGDTSWASMYAAYEALSAPMRELLDGLSALHSIDRLARRSKVVRDTLGDKLRSWPSTIHPLVEVHPETGRKALNANCNWTTEIVGMTPTESEMILNFLFDHVKEPSFQVRFRWQKGDVAFWDNRAGLHNAAADYTERRTMKRVALVGHKPMGPRDVMSKAAE